MIEWIAAGIALVGAGAAIWQAHEARKARTNAEHSESAAKEQADRAAVAAETAAAATTRSAAALEERNRIEREQIEASAPWSVERIGSDRWRITNNTRAIARLVRFHPINGERIDVEDPEDINAVAHGSPVFLGFGGGLTDPTVARVRVTWIDANTRRAEAIIVLG